MIFDKIKIAFFDVDGTLYSSTTREISKKTVQALKALKNNGVKVCVATGRPKDFLDLLKPYLDDIQFDYYVTNNGQAIYDENHDIIYKNYLHPEDVKSIIKKANELDLCISVIGEDYNLISKENELVTKSFEYLNAVTPTSCIIDEDFNQPVDNLVCYESIDYMRNFKQVIKHSVITYWTTSTFDFVPDNGVKVNGIKKVINHLNLESENVIAFGDGQNDMDMLEYVGFGVAMGNSTLEIQEVADYVASHIDEDGVAHTLAMIKLI